MQLRSRSRAMDAREPCQAGNRAALSGMFHVPRGRRFRSCIRRTLFSFREVCVMYQALYRKWRPKTFSDVIGQSHITQTLKSRWRRGGPPMPTCSPAPGEPERPPVPKSWPRLSTVSIRWMGTPAASVPAVRESKTAAFWMCWSWTPPPTTAVDQVRALRDEADLFPPPM